MNASLTQMTMLNEVKKRAQKHGWSISELITRAALYQHIAFSPDSTDEEIEWSAKWAIAYYQVAQTI